MGKFDKMRSKADTPRALKKQKVAGEAPKSLSDEKQSALGIFNKVMGKTTEKKAFDVVKVRVSDELPRLLFYQQKLYFQCVDFFSFVLTCIAV